MSVARECPLCGSNMRLKQTEVVTHVPGNPEPSTRVVREWVCPECDYFEEADEEAT
jgi:transposase